MGGSQKPAYADVRSQLFDFSAAAEELQNGASIREAEEKAARLEEANEALKAAIEAEREEFNAEKEYLKVQFLEANYEIDRFREEEKEREKKEREIPETQLKILRLLPGEQSGNALSINQIAHALRLPEDEVEVHASKLWKAGLAISHYSRREKWTWRRTMEGNSEIVSRRLAGEEEEETYKYADLSKIQYSVLMIIAGNEPDGASEKAIAQRIGKPLVLVRRNLRLLRDAEMATDEEQPGEAFTASNGPEGPMWHLLRNGEDYLAERGLF